MPEAKIKQVGREVPVLLPLSEVEKIPETPKEKSAVAVPEKPTTEKEFPGGRAPAPVPIFPAPLPAPVDPITKEIEAILEEDLAKVYASLPDDVKPKFKAQGEIVARNIRQMLQEAKVKTRKVLKLIVDWLKMIPGVNKFFLEQEAAIKTQKIMILAEEEEKK